MDFYGISFIASFYTEIISILGNITTYLTNTHFYSVLSGLFGSKVEIDKPTNILRSIDKSSNGVQENNKISDWFNKQEVIQEESSNKKYYIIGALFLLSCLTWYYYGDNITPIINTGIEKLKSFRRRPGDDGVNSPNSINSDLQNDTWRDSISNIWNKIKEKFKRTDTTVTNNTNIKPNVIEKQFTSDGKSIELIDKTQPIASTSKLAEEKDHYFPIIDKGKAVDPTELTQSEINRRIIEQATGRSLDQFQDESSLLYARVNHFIDLHETDSYPSNAIKLGLYDTLKAKLLALSITAPKLYTIWLGEPNVAKTVNDFYKLGDTFTKEVKTEEQQVVSYNEVALSTIDEQEAWSSEPNSSIHSPYVQQDIVQPLSPLNIEKESKEQILQDDLQAMSNLAFEKIEKPLDKLFEEKPELKFDLLQLDKNPKLPDKFKTAKDTDKNWLEEIRSRRNDKHVIDDTNKEVQADINLATEEVKPKSGFSALLDQIRSKRNDKNVIDDTNKEVAKDNKDLTSLINQELDVNDQDLMDKVKEVFSEDLNLKCNLGESSNTEVPKSIPKIEIDSESNSSLEHFFPKVETKPNTGFNALFDSIKARRDDSNVIGSPNLSQVGLQPKLSPIIQNKPSISNLFEDTVNLFEDEEDIEPIIEVNEDIIEHIPEITDNILPSEINWNSTSVEFIKNDRERSFKLNFGDTWRAADKIHIVTNDNYTASIDFNSRNYVQGKPVTFDWGHEITKLDNFGIETQIKEIWIEDLNHINHSIYKKAS